MLESPSHQLKILLVALLAGGAGLHNLKILLVVLLAGGAGLSTLILVTTD